MITDEVSLQEFTEALLEFPEDWQKLKNNICGWTISHKKHDIYVDVYSDGGRWEKVSIKFKIGSQSVTQEIPTRKFKPLVENILDRKYKEALVKNSVPENSF